MQLFGYNANRVWLALDDLAYDMRMTLDDAATARALGQHRDEQAALAKLSEQITQLQGVTRELCNKDIDAAERKAGSL